jgi:hypothetical protein
MTTASDQFRKWLHEDRNADPPAEEFVIAAERFYGGEFERLRAENAELRRQVEEAKAEQERASAVEKAACDCVIDLARAMAGEYPGMGHTECELRLARTGWALSNKLTTAQAALAALRQQLDECNGK